MSMTDTASSNIAKNIRTLRESRSLSQDQLARLSGIPRPTWSNLESGAANPTINVLIKVASTLQVTLEELISPPREAVMFYPHNKLAVQRRGEAHIRKLLPVGIPGVDFDRIEIPPGARFAGIPHRGGTREYLTCEQGTIELALSGEKYRLTEGDVVVFRGDQRHSYSNPTRAKSIGFSVVLLSPSPL